MSEPPADLPDLNVIPKVLHPVRCGECGEHWWVRVGIEFWPPYCCYCGVKFLFSTEHTTGRKMTMGGQPIEEPPR